MVFYRAGYETGGLILEEKRQRPRNVVTMSASLARELR